VLHASPRNRGGAVVVVAAVVCVVLYIEMSSRAVQEASSAFSVQYAGTVTVDNDDVNGKNSTAQAAQGALLHLNIIARKTVQHVPTAPAEGTGRISPSML
jgi:hypothetical protein